MIIWLNGPFGAGKTTVASEMQKLCPEVRIFDPEWVGYMLRANLDGYQFSDFQHLEAWRRITPLAAREVSSLTGQSLIAVQTVLDSTSWEQLNHGFSAQGDSVLHVLLECTSTALRKRINEDKVEVDAVQWRLDHIDAYYDARTWLIDTVDLALDTTNCDPSTIAKQVLNAAGLLV